MRKSYVERERVVEPVRFRPRAFESKLGKPLRIWHELERMAWWLGRPRLGGIKSGRGGRIRTADLLAPNQAL